MKRLLLALVCVLAGVPLVHACSLVDEARVVGWLGSTWEGGPRTGPANLASRDPLEDGTAFRVGSIELWRVPEGTTSVEGRDGTIVLDATPDTVPPSTPLVREVTLQISESDSGCGATSSCGTITTLDYDVDASDDRAARNALSFAIWLSAEPEAPVGEPTHFVVARDFTGGTRLWTYAQREHEGRDLWATIQVFDQAGNASELSEPFLVDTGRRGCATSGAPRQALASLLPLLAALVIARRRRAR